MRESESRPAECSGGGTRRCRLRLLMWLLLASLSGPSIAQAQDGPETEEAAPEEAATDGSDEALESDSEGASEEAPGGTSEEAPEGETGSPEDGEGAPAPGDATKALLGEPIPVPSDLDEETAKEYEAYRQAASRYLLEVNEYRTELSSVVMSEYKSKLSNIDTVYQQQIDELRDDERSQRVDAIQRLERFLEKHGDSERYAPGVLYRLAVLHYEKADDEYLAADPETLTRDYPDYSQSVYYSSELIRRFPDFPQLDGAYYLKGFCLNQMEDEDGALDAFMALGTKYPKSLKAAEAWTRVGEYYFNRSQEAVQGIGQDVHWEKAKSYYKKAVDMGPEYAIYDRALYRLAWTEYYVEDYDSMIFRFIELVEWADKVPQGSALRQEAIEFMAAALAEEDWNLQDDISRDPDFGMVRFNRYLNEDRAFELEVLRVYADTLSDQTRFDFAAEAYESLLSRDPCNPENPKIHQALIASLNLSDQGQRAVTIQAALDEIYGKGSDWYSCQEQEGNLEAIAYAENTSRKAMKFSISTYLAEANEADEYAEQVFAEMQAASRPREQAALQAAYQEADQRRIEAFALTAKTTGQFLDRYPNDEDVYVYRYILADSAYRSGNFEGAAVAFDQVRDVVDGRYRRDSANGAIDAYSILLYEKAKAGEVDARGLPPWTIKELYAGGATPATQVPTYLLKEIVAEDLGDVDAASAELEAREGKATVQEELPAEALAVMAARDKYMEYQLDNQLEEGGEPLADDYKYLNALTYYHYGHQEESEARFSSIIDEYPCSDFAVVGMGFIVAIYEEKGDADLLAAKIDELRALDLCAGESEVALDARLEDIKYGALFEKATKLYNEEKYADAAKEFERIADENPDFENIHLALLNAGVSYGEIGHYESAMRLYLRVYEEYEETPEAAKALYLVGFNSERFFDFETAVSSYISLYEDEREPFQQHPSRVSALKKAAVILKYTAEFERAAELFERYHDENKSQADSAQLLYEAGVMYENMDDYRSMASTFEKFRKSYGNDPELRVLVLQSYLKQGDHFKEKRDFKRASVFYEKALSLYASNPEVGGRDANYLAAKAQFMLGDIEYLEWAEITLSGTLKQFKKRVAAKKEGAGTVATEFKKVLVLKNGEWTMAALYRIGSMFHNFADSMENASCPPSFDEDTCDGFLEGLLEGAFELQAKARENYEAVVAFGTENNVVNEWTKKSLNGLNDIAPKEYPMFEGERSAIVKRTTSPGSLMDVAGLSPEDDERDAPRGLDEEEEK